MENVIEGILRDVLEQSGIDETLRARIKLALVGATPREDGEGKEL